MLMANLRQFRSLRRGLNLGATTAGLALAIVFVFVLTVVTTGVAHAQSFQVLYTFTGGLDGAQPYSGLTIDGSGSLYGTTHTGNGGTDWGNVYALRHRGTSWIFDKLQLFDGALYNRPVFGPDHTLYGTSPNQLTTYPNGYIYNLRPPANAVCATISCPWIATLVYGFLGGSDGGSPRYGDLIFDHSGNMYGTAALGGSGNGVVYEITRSGSGWSEQPIYTFSGSPDGATPFGGPIFDNAGNLYGTTTAGGLSGHGAVFELSPAGSGWTEKVIYSFQGASDGNNPTAGPIMDQSGNLYGSTNNGGAGGGGTIFELTPSGGGWTYSLLYSFTGGSNCGPWGALALDASGNLYGTTVCDGVDNDGNVFKLTPSGGGWTYSSLYDFAGGNDGRLPYCNVTLDPSGKMYGTTSRGGSFGAGVVWQLTP